MSVSEEEFRRSVEPHRAELLAHCYRMLGSVHDAEDALQDALLRAWRALPRFRGQSSLRSWLYRIATNASLDVIERRQRRVEVDPFPDAELDEEQVGPEARYELREGVELAFVAALQHLPGAQRAVLILRDVLGFRAAEVAEMLETTVDSVNSALSRARRTADERLPERSQQATLRALGDARVRALVEQYMDALDRGDVEAIMALLSEDATWSMPPLEESYAGAVAIREFLTAGPLRFRWRHIATRASGQVAVGCYRWDGERFAADVLDVLTVRDDRVAAVTSYPTRENFARFGLPDRFGEDEYRPEPRSSRDAEHPEA
jgi:RNA polymerase sigma-70 factor (ECF subfamily)